MIRCRQCRQPNPDKALNCSACGVLLPEPPPPPPSWALELGGRSWFRIIGAVLAVLALRMTVQPLVSTRSGASWNYALVLVGQAVLLGAALAWLRGLRRPWALLAWAFAGGLLSFGFDMLVTWRWVGFKGIWAAGYFFTEGEGSRAAEVALGVLQVLRFLGPALALWLWAAFFDRRPKAILIGLAGLVTAVVFQFWIRGAGLSWLKPDAASVSLYAFSVFALFSSLFGNSALSASGADDT